jgi:hypothetical protein
MRFLRRSLTGVFLLAVTLALTAWAGAMVQGAVSARMNEEPRSFPQRERILAVNVITLDPVTITPELTVFGELRSQRTLDLRSAIGGTVLEASDALVEGGTVTAGQLFSNTSTDASCCTSNIYAPKNAPIKEATMAQINVENMEENADLFMAKMGFPHDADGLNMTDEQLVNFVLL